ncbi:hypothetical protein [Pedobacter chitinilyticus]|nr:hypothetical protein [Pedobacter chitinilyticus]
MKRKDHFFRPQEMNMGASAQVTDIKGNRGFISVSQIEKIGWP